MRKWQKSGMAFGIAWISLPVLSCVLSAPVPVETKISGSVHDAGSRIVTIHHNSALTLPQTEGVLELRDAQTTALLDRLERWPTADGQIATIDTQPVVLDVDLDGAADAVYAIDRNGLLWFSKLNASGFNQISLVADFSGQGFIFNQPMLLLQTLSADQSGRQMPLVMLLLVVEGADGSHSLIAVKHQSQVHDPIRFESLVDRNTIDDDEIRYGIEEQVWEQIRRQSGWISRLPGRITIAPQVYAGVVYLVTAPVAAVRSDCSLEEGAEAMLSALHLHHAGLVYARRTFSISPLSESQLVLIQNDQGDFSLVLVKGEEQQTLLNELLSISEECADCTTLLEPQAFPRVIRLATFQLEDGAH